MQVIYLLLIAIADEQYNRFWAVCSVPSSCNYSYSSYVQPYSMTWTNSHVNTAVVTRLAKEIM